jgi:hypothetical protein
VTSIAVLYFAILALALALFMADGLKGVLRGHGNEVFHWIMTADSAMAGIWRALEGMWPNVLVWTFSAAFFAWMALRDRRRKNRRRIREAIGAKTRALRDRLVRRVRALRPRPVLRPVPGGAR